MTDKKEEKEGNKVSLGELPWKKEKDKYVDVFSEITTLHHSERAVALDFGVLEDEGKQPVKGGGLTMKNPYISHRVRIKLTIDHFKEFVEMVNNRLEKLSIREEKNEES